MKYTAIGVIPGGSANGYAKSICEESKEELNPQTCAYIIVKGETKMFDLMEIESPSNPNKIYSFLSITWGIIADIDLESEKFRCCGSARFTLYGIYLLVCQRNYYGTIYYASEDAIDETFKFPSLSEELDPKYFKKESKSFAYFYACLVPWVADFAKVAPKSFPTDGFCDLIVIITIKILKYFFSFSGFNLIFLK
jgi:sphingosine kinase